MLSGRPRRARRRSAHPSRRATNTDLTPLALRLEAEAEATGWDVPPAIVQVCARGVIVSPLSEEQCPIDELVGLDLQRRCTAVGLVAEAVAYDLDLDPGPLPPDPCHSDPSTDATARTVVLVHRSGDAVSVLRRRGHEPIVMAPWPDATSGGRVHDLCRLALGLITPPPSTPTVHLWATVWLDRLVSAQCRDTGSIVTWIEAANLHPAVDAFAPEHVAGDGMSIHDLGRLGDILGSLHTWNDLRRSCASGELAITGLRPSWAAHLDDGAFSRWVLGSFPTAPDLLALARSLLPSTVADGVETTLHAWGVPTDARQR